MKITLVLVSLLFTSFAFSQDIKQLSKDTTWHRLLHYKKTWKGLESEADTQDFFLAKDGKNNPESELNAAIAAFNSNDKNIVCRFPARYQWLKKHVAVKDFSVEGCDEYVKFRDKLGAKSASLIFSSYYINTPASAFGHTFLRMNRHPHGAKKEDRTELLDYGINYAAMMDTQNALVYAIKGIFGLFPGVLTAVPYYYKVREYNDHESRDLWEYELNLSQEQLNFMIAHLWEMGQSRFDYYYFTENCSYQILAVIDLVNPNFSLVDRIPFYVIPVDTVRAAVEESGLVISKVYRPSALTKLELGTKGMKVEKLTLIKNLAHDPARYEKDLVTLKTDEERAEVLDRSIEAMDFLYAKDLLIGKGEKKEEKHKLLVMRAMNPVISEDKEYKVSANMYPDRGHRSQRVGLSQGYSQGEGSYQLLSMRFALHDMLDPLPGQPPHSEITFADVGLRLQKQNYTSTQKLLINHLDIFRVKSLQPVTPWQQNYSWNARIGMNTLRDEVYKDQLSPAIELGGGGSFGFGKDQTSLITLMTKLDLNQQSHFEHGWRFGVGPELSARFIFSDYLSLGMMSSYKWRTYFSNNDFSSTSFQRGAELRWHFMKAWNVFLKTDWYDIKGQTNQWSELGFYHYF